tara:strand:- start:490 stop:1200 length:711 start_codon:yes stop_codon:yes gene_type:complete
MKLRVFISSVQKEFVLARINRSVGARKESLQAPVTYELPPAAVTEAVINSIAHRDYNSNGSVEVRLFSDRLEIWNPGRLPDSLSLELLREYHPSIPTNPLIAESLNLARYMERAGSGTQTIIQFCKDLGLLEPLFEQRGGSFVITLFRKIYKDETEVLISDPVLRVVFLLEAVPLAPSIMMKKLGLKHRATFKKNYLQPALDLKYLSQTIPSTPTSPSQKYCLTKKGRVLLMENKG